MSLKLYYLIFNNINLSIFYKNYKKINIIFNLLKNHLINIIAKIFYIRYIFL
uniref:Uncharacterized protein n=1 Tax=viral metagenome TaxID=1070528 RepID=A0A6C0EEJ9_9ZZZZ